MSAIGRGARGSYLQTLTEVGAEQNSTVIFPMPLDIVTPLLKLLQAAAEAPHAEPGASKPADRAGPPIQ